MLREPDWNEFPPLERRDDVTICIAAHCDMNRDPKIVLCSDHKLTGALGSAETGMKQKAIGRNLVAMFAGDASAAKMGIPLLQKHLRPTSKLDETNIVSFVRAALNERKKDLANELSYGRFALSYDDLLKFGKEKLPEEAFETAIFDISRIKIGAQFIIAGYIDSFPMIIETDDFCGAVIKEHFAAIGEGRYLAHSVLLHREHHEMLPLGTTIYSTYEAKRYAERVASVGPRTEIAVLHGNGIPRWVKKEGFADLQKRYGEYGPKPIPHEIAFADDLFTDEEFWSSQEQSS